MGRGGEIQINFIGMGRNASFGRAPLPYFSVRLEHLGHVGVEFADLFGGSMTWDQLSNLVLKWGNNEIIKYNGVKPGWTYWWEIGTWNFIVTDDLGNVKTEKATTISDLGITWDIFESHQFSIHFSAKFENTAFLIAWKYKRGVLPPDDEDTPPDRYAEVPKYLWGEFDKYLNETMQVKFGGFVDKLTYVGETETLDINISTNVKTALLAKTINFSASADFSLDLAGIELNGMGEKKYREAVAETYMIGNLLMIRLFASIYDMSKPVFEPWMLWHMWQWFGSSGVTIKRDRVFDLSPWWG